MTNDFSCFFLIPHFLGQISMHIPMNALFFHPKKSVVNHEMLRIVHPLYNIGMRKTVRPIEIKLRTNVKFCLKIYSLFEHF